MLPIVYELASGRPIFVAVALLVAGVLAVAVGSHPRLKAAALAIACVAMVVLLFSAIPQPVWLLVAFWLACVLWIAAEVVRAPRLDAPRRGAQATVVTLAIAVALLEGAWLAPPRLPSRQFDRLLLVGDSVTAGIGGAAEITWPRMLQERYGIDVVDPSMAGAKVRDAAEKQATKLGDDPGLVLLEIGGNDLLSRTPLDRFEHDLGALLRGVARPNRTLVMLELPTPPFHAGYTRIQRRLAREHDVVLIPRRYFVGVIRDPSATLDSVHLSPDGQTRMAAMLGAVLGGSFRAAPAGVYERR